jgi:coenzyme F420-reducing hydrogenase gamma subunit
MTEVAEYIIINVMSKKVEEKKLRVGWFTFTCCEDSTVIFTEVLNDHWQEWRKLINFVHARVLQANNKLDKLDVAFVEGAISSEEQKKRLEEIREKSKVLVAVGACAVTGMPSSQRNNFDEEQQKEIQFILDRFHHLDKVQSLKDIVKVDADLPGCPMNGDSFVKVVEGALKDFKIV